MQNKFIRSIIYIVVGTILAIFLAIQPFNLYCKNTKKCQPITLSSTSVSKKGEKQITIDFSATTPESLKNIVEFKPETTKITANSGEYMTNFYIVKNISNNPITVRIRYKIEPSEADQYLDRIECLCMQNQSLEPQEESKMPIKLQIKPEFEKENNIKAANITYAVELIE